MSKSKDFIVTINESRFGVPRGNLVLDLYESGVTLYDGTILGTAVINTDNDVAKGIPTDVVGDYLFEKIPYNKKYTVVISGTGVTTQIPSKLTDIDIGLPYNVTGADIPYKNNTNISIQTAFESLDATSSIPRIVALESDVDTIQSDIVLIENDIDDLYTLIGDTTSSIVPRVESLETITTEQQDDINNINVEIEEAFNIINIEYSGTQITDKRYRTISSGATVASAKAVSNGRVTLLIKGGGDGTTSANYNLFKTTDLHNYVDIACFPTRQTIRFDSTTYTFPTDNLFKNSLLDTTGITTFVGAVLEDNIVRTDGTINLNGCKLLGKNIFITVPQAENRVYLNACSGLEIYVNSTPIFSSGTLQYQKSLSYINLI